MLKWFIRHWLVITPIIVSTLELIFSSWEAWCTKQNTDYVKHHNQEEDKIAQRKTTIFALDKLDKVLRYYTNQINQCYQDTYQIQIIETNIITYIGRWAEKYVLDTHLCDIKLISLVERYDLHIIQTQFSRQIHICKRLHKYHQTTMDCLDLINSCDTIHHEKR